MTLDRRPTLRGETVAIRPLVEADREPLAAVAADPLIWEQHPADRHRREEFDPFFDEALASGGAVAVGTLAGELIGTSRFHAVGGDPGVIEIGWTFLARSHWGGATNRELKALMLDHAFTAVDRVGFRVAPDNHRSQRAVEKLGATRLPGPASDGMVASELTREAWGRNRSGRAGIDCGASLSTRSSARSAPLSTPRCDILGLASLMRRSP